MAGLNKFKKLGLATLIALSSSACGPLNEYNIDGGGSCTIELTDDNFEAEILRSEKPCAVDFYTDWCYSCRDMEPIFNKLSCEYKEQMKFGEYDAESGFYGEYYAGTKQYPVFIFFCRGEPWRYSFGIQTERALRSIIERTVADCK